MAGRAKQMVARGGAAVKKAARTVVHKAKRAPAAASQMAEQVREGASTMGDRVADVAETVTTVVAATAGAVVGAVPAVTSGNETESSPKAKVRPAAARPARRAATPSDREPPESVYQ